ncbi:hypothetical protein B0O99DRAFT_672863 [Bisporella sp. PMI_857]|nr:hypothetical protein B0O99DRAFT_672863 [Bisporella sp. PMI_857]
MYAVISLTRVVSNWNFGPYFPDIYRYQVTMEREIYSCCDPSSPSPIWTGQSTGTVINIGDIETYIAQPQQLSTTNLNSEQDVLPANTNKCKRVILHLTEGHSIYFLNAQLLADSFSSHLNCPVIMPDLFAGKERVPKNQTPHFPPGKQSTPPGPHAEEAPPPPPYFLKESSEAEFEAWKASVEPGVTDPIIGRVVRWIRETYGAGVGIAGVGYCFGGRYVVRLMGADVIDVGVVNHPSFFTMEEVSKLGEGKRLAVFAAERDEILPKEKRRRMEDLLEERGATWVSTVFGGTEHGFAVRGDLEVKEVRMAKESAFMGAVKWFREWL